MRDVALVGVSMVKFGRYPDRNVADTGAQAIIFGTPGTDPSGWQGGRLVSPPCGPDNIDLRWLVAFPFEGDYSRVGRQVTLEKGPELAFVNPGTSALAGFVNESSVDAGPTFQP